MSASLVGSEMCIRDSTRPPAQMHARARTHARTHAHTRTHARMHAFSTARAGSRSNRNHEVMTDGSEWDEQLGRVAEQGKGHK
eukprot:212773-Alexandrium_andersonii.AAC.1